MKTSSSSKQEVVAIVDAYNSGKLLAPEFIARGLPCIHVQSRAAVPKNYRNSLNKADFVETITHAGSIEKTVARLKEYSVKCVIPGHELGVCLADELSERLGLVSNGTALSRARRDKYEMMETLKRFGIRTMQHFKSDRLAELIDWTRRHRSWPVVLKPLDSCGSDGVWLCHSEHDLHAAFRTLFGKPNYLGIMNRELLIQEFVSGTEFIVDTISGSGTHRLTDIWRYRKIQANGAPFVYDTVELMPFGGRIQEKLADYAFQVLDALGIRNGPAHMEIMHTATEPVLIEVGARLGGGALSKLVAHCTGSNPIELLANAYLRCDPDSFLGNSPKPPVMKKNALAVCLIAKQAGILKALPHLDEIKKMESFYGMTLKAKEGDFLPKTIDLTTSPGQIDLVHEDPKVIHSDCKRIRELEKNGFYTIFPEKVCLRSGETLKEAHEEPSIPKRHGKSVHYEILATSIGPRSYGNGPRLPFLRRDDRLRQTSKP